MTAWNESEPTVVGASGSIAAETVRAFVSAINRRDIDALAELMTEDHRFTDSLGHEVRGRDAMRKGWSSYLEMFPDYSIIVDASFHSGTEVVVLGSAHGTYAVHGRLLPANRWQMPAAWRATIRGQHVAEWQVFADNDSVRRIMDAEQQ